MNCALFTLPAERAGHDAVAVPGGGSSTAGCDLGGVVGGLCCHSHPARVPARVLGVHGHTGGSVVVPPSVFDHRTVLVLHLQLRVERWMFVVAVDVLKLMAGQTGPGGDVRCVMLAACYNMLACAGIHRCSCSLLVHAGWCGHGPGAAGGHSLPRLGAQLPDVHGAAPTCNHYHMLCSLMTYSQQFWSGAGPALKLGALSLLFDSIQHKGLASKTVSTTSTRSTHSWLPSDHTFVTQLHLTHSLTHSLTLSHRWPSS